MFLCACMKLHGVDIHLCKHVNPSLYTSSLCRVAN